MSKFYKSLTERELFAFASGLALRGRIGQDVRSRNQKITTTGSNVEPVKIGGKEGIKLNGKPTKTEIGEVVRIPIYVSNNNIKDNGVGFSSFVYQLQFPTAHLTYLSWDQDGIENKYDGQIVVDGNSNKTGILKVKGMRPILLGNRLDNHTLMFLTFRVNENVPPGVDRVDLKFRGNAGQGITDLLTIQKGYDGYLMITPLALKHPYVYFTAKPPPPPTEFPMPSPSQPVYVGPSTVIDFTITDMVVSGGSGLHDSVKGHLVVISGGKVVGSFELGDIPLNGNFSTSGRFPITVDGTGYEDLEFKIELELPVDEEDDYYIFIPFGGFEWEVTTEEDPDVIIPKPIKTIRLLEQLEFREVVKSSVTAPIRNVTEELTIRDYSTTNRSKHTVVDGGSNDGGSENENGNRDGLGFGDYYVLEFTRKRPAFNGEQYEEVATTDYFAIENSKTTKRTANETIHVSDFHVLEFERKPRIFSGEEVDEVAVNDFYSLTKIPSSKQHGVENVSFGDFYAFEREKKKREFSGNEQETLTTNDFYSIRSVKNVVKRVEDNNLSISDYYVIEKTKRGK